MERVNLLWFDDDLVPRRDERDRLDLWLHYFHTGDRQPRIRLIEVFDLAGFAQELQHREALPAGHAEHIDAFLVDVLWHEPNRPGGWLFTELDPAFAGERVISLDAGAQLIGLMRNRRYDRQRPKWMRRFQNHPTAVLTTHTDSRDTLVRHIDPSAIPSIHVLTKVDPEPEEPYEPAAEFREWVTRLRRHAPPGETGEPARHD